MIVRDLMVGNPDLRRKGLDEEALGHNAILAGFQGQRHWTDHMPNGDFLETILNSSFDWNGIRQPYLVATENDSLNGVAMLFGHLLTGTAQIFSDVRTYWSPDAVERVTGWKPSGAAANGFIHLINSGATCMDGTGRQKRDGKSVMKPYWQIEPREAEACLAATSWRYASLGYFRGGGYSSDFLTEGGMDVTMTRLNIVRGLGPVLQIAEGSTVSLPGEVHDKLDLRTDPTWPTTWFVPRITGLGSLQGRLLRDGGLGRQPRRHLLRPHRGRPHEPGSHAPHPHRHAQRRGGPRVQAQLLVGLRHGRRGRRLPRLRRPGAALRK